MVFVDFYVCHSVNMHQMFIYHYILYLGIILFTHEYVCNITMHYHYIWQCMHARRRTMNFINIPMLVTCTCLCVLLWLFFFRHQATHSTCVSNCESRSQTTNSNPIYRHWRYCRRDSPASSHNSRHHCHNCCIHSQKKKHEK